MAPRCKSVRRGRWPVCRSPILVGVVGRCNKERERKMVISVRFANPYRASS